MPNHTLRELARGIYPWMTPELVDIWVDAYTEFGPENPQLLLSQVRQSDEYDAIFPGIRRDDGSLRVTERQYFSTIAQYRNTLEERGINPDIFEGRYAELISDEVSGQEFESRVAAVNENIAQQSEEIRQAFAEASGVQDFSPQAVLATVLDPDGVGRELLERRIAVSQVRGAAAESGISRSRERAEELVQRGIGLQQARQFYSGLESQVSRFNTIAQAARGERSVRQRDVEAAGLLNDQEQIRNLTQLFARERAAFSSRRGLVSSNRSGAMTGLGARGQ